MSLDAWLTIGILVLTFVALLATKLPPATVFLGALTLSVTFDLAPLARSLAGFTNPGVLTIGALFMVAAGMYTTGAISLLSEKLIGRPKTMLGAQLKILPPIAIGSAFLNNTPLVAVSRNDQPVSGRIADVQIEVGDVGVLEVDEFFFFVNAKESEFSLVRRLRGYSIQRWDKAIAASLITAAMITSAAMG
jgi:hypothetical protein